MEETMQTHLADQNKETARLVRFGPSTSRPRSPAQPPWKGSPPPAVKKIMTRDALAEHLRGQYSRWASNFALLTDTFLVQVFEREMDRIKALQRDKWTDFFPFSDWCYCKVGDDYLWVQKQDGGWTVELCHPGTDPDARVLTINNMPVLCPEGIWAARLALACYPNPPANLVWHSYW
jgi:hypothetical protein